jgi:hypothetical protein
LLAICLAGSGVYLLNTPTWLHLLLCVFMQDFSLLAHWRDQWMPYYSPHSLGRNVAYLVKELPANKVADGNGKAQ